MDDPKEYKEIEESIKVFQGHTEKESGEAWIKYVSLSMIFLAVLAAFAGQRSTVFSTTVMKELNEATFDQAAASNQWSYYEAKSIKQSLAQNDLDALHLSTAPDRARIDDLTARARRYDSEEQAIMKEAAAAEARRDAARQAAARAASSSQRMSVASTVFQAAIAIGGVCLTVRKQWVWWLSLLLGAVAAVLTGLVLLSA